MNITSYITDKIVKLIGKVQWKQTHEITFEQKDRIKHLLKDNYFIILTRRSNHLSTYFISLGHFLMTGKFGRYSHVLMNLEDTVTTDADFRFIEATGVGVKYSTFEDVFDGVDSVCLLRPNHLTNQEWTSILDRAKTQLGKPYDTLFDLTNDKALSCVELVRVALKSEPDYDHDFEHFEHMIAKYKNLTPQMFRDCETFAPILELKN